MKFLYMFNAMLIGIFLVQQAVAQVTEERLAIQCPTHISSCTVTPVGTARVTAYHCLRDCVDVSNYRFSEDLDLIVLEEGTPDFCEDPLVGDIVFLRGWFDYPYTFLSIPSFVTEYLLIYKPNSDSNELKLVLNIESLVYPGFSGGPIRDEDGHVVGMIYATGAGGTSVLAISEICNFLNNG